MQGDDYSELLKACCMHWADLSSKNPKRTSHSHRQMFISFHFKCIFHQKSEKMGERMSKERQRDKAQVERREEREKSFMLTPSWQSGEKSKRRARRCRGQTEVREMRSRQGLSWRHYSWLIEWELVWQFKTGCHVAEGEQKTGEWGRRGPHKQEECECVCLLLLCACQAVNICTFIHWTSVSQSFWLCSWE